MRKRNGTYTPVEVMLGRKVIRHSGAALSLGEPVTSPTEKELTTQEKVLEIAKRLESSTPATSSSGSATPTATSDADTLMAEQMRTSMAQTEVKKASSLGELAGLAALVASSARAKKNIRPLDKKEYRTAMARRRGRG